MTNGEVIKAIFNVTSERILEYMPDIVEIWIDDTTYYLDIDIDWWNADYTGNKGFSSLEVWNKVKFDLNNYIDEYGLEDSDIMKTVNYIIDKNMKGV